MEFSEQLLGDSQSENDKINKVSDLTVLTGPSDWNTLVGTRNSI